MYSNRYHTIPVVNATNVRCWYSPYGCKMLHTVENVILLIGFDVYIRTYFHSLKDRLTWVASSSYNHTDGWDTNLSVPAQHVVTGTDVSSYILRDS
ncbi:hypothetical protein C0J52_02491 [Blattella germanica]|nr:hypothetical protein C0J52_02491 [Blattella germanica]